jgi:hypothetical protein
MKCLVFSLLLFGFLKVSASEVPIEGFPKTLVRQILAERIILEGRESQVYRFHAKQDLPTTVVLLKDWLNQKPVAAQVSHRDGWTYVSQRRSGWWVTAQVRELATTSQVEGLLMFWKHRDNADQEAKATLAAVNSLGTLRQSRILRQVQSVDAGRTAVTLTIISKLSLGALSDGFETDFRRIGLNTASHSPMSQRTQVWVGKNTQISITLFEHRGESAAVIHWMGVNAKEAGVL